MCFLREGAVAPQCQAPVQSSTPTPTPGVTSLYEFMKKRLLIEAQSLPSGRTQGRWCDHPSMGYELYSKHEELQNHSVRFSLWEAEPHQWKFSFSAYSVCAPRGLYGAQLLNSPN